jgi:alpha-1,4-glucan:alpha-1,4-glucan 6-glycosyltransferase/4-alpha-glucanotransferase
VTRIPDLERCPVARAVLESGGFRAELEKLQARSLIDYRAVMTLKRTVLQELAHCLSKQDSERKTNFKRFVKTHPRVDDYAAFRAKNERERLPWRRWPEESRDGKLTATDYDEAAKHYHLYVQWQTDEQMRSLGEKTKGEGPALYLDFPLGVNLDGYDVWRERSVFALEASGGAPPDLFFTKGQSWGFPPFNPEGLRRQGYRYYIDSLRHHLRYSGMLRIDHVIGLHRLYWVPEGVAPSEGVFVRYPAEEFYAILNLESHRHRARIVGENLGTVPSYVNNALAKHKIYGMYVGQFDVGTTQKDALRGALPGTVASLNTHDTATFAGFWSGSDIEDRLDLGLLSDAERLSQQEIRARQRDALINYLRSRGWLNRQAADASEVLKAWLCDLATGAADLVLINIEDLWLEHLPQNVPGTWDERPNWQRQARFRLEEIRSTEAVREIFQAVDKWRCRKGKQKIMVAEQSLNLLTNNDIYLFNEGSHFRLYDKLGAHPVQQGSSNGTHFAVWAPNAEEVFVMGDFNDWDNHSHRLLSKGQSGIWEGFFPGIGVGTLYKYHIVSRVNGYRVDKADPFSFFNEIPPKTASIVWNLDYTWGDTEWMATRHQRNALDKPIATYEMHIGSWRRLLNEGNRSYSYRELAPELAEYLHEQGYTHVEFLPIMDHPFFGSWGYQITGYFAPSGNYGTPQDLMYLIDVLHQRGIGVILDWVPSHFPSDQHGLGFFDGTHLYEHADPRQGYHPEWNSFIFNYGRNEVQSFLISNALFWLDRYHVDGLRVDAVASMLYLDYGRKEGEWIPNKYGGRENIAAIEFLRRMNVEVYQRYPDVQTIAEESTAWPMVSRPAYLGGLGFGLKWDMGWMHDTLQYMSQDPIYRRYHQNKLTFRMLYAFHENFVLPLSHDEVVYGKGSLIGKMPGDEWQRFANLRLMYAYMYAQPAKKLLFMGGEFGQWWEWAHDWSLDWSLLHQPRHSGLLQWVRDLNRIYRNEPALHELDCDPAGFEWIDCNDADSSVFTLLRKGRAAHELILVTCNFTPVVRANYRVGAPSSGFWREILNSDAADYGGSGLGNMGGVDAVPVSVHGRPYSLTLTLPPLAAVFLKPAGH